MIKSKTHPCLVAVCHNIRSRHNVGAIFRTSDGVGVDKIYLCGITPAPPHSRIEKVSLGAENFVPWEQYLSEQKPDDQESEKVGIKETLSMIKKLKKRGFEIIALEQTNNSVPYYKFKPKPDTSIALVLGYEVDGLPEAILAKCDKIIEIPMVGKKESLNVSVAFGIAVYEIAKSLKKF